MWFVSFYKIILQVDEVANYFCSFITPFFFNPVKIKTGKKQQQKTYIVTIMVHHHSRLFNSMLLILNNFVKVYNNVQVLN